MLLICQNDNFVKMVAFLILGMVFGFYAQFLSAFSVLGLCFYLFVPEIGALFFENLCFEWICG